MTNKNTQTSLFYNLLSALFAFVLWGGWAYYINATQADEASNAGIIAGLTQGTASFIITFIIVRLVAYFYHLVSASAYVNASLAKLFIPAIFTVSITGTGLFMIHFFMNTPHIAITIAPALVIALLFSLFTVYKLQQNQTIEN